MLNQAKPDKPHALRTRPKALILTDLVFEPIQEPVPEGKRRSNSGDKAAAMLDTLQVGMGLRVNRREDTIRSRITHYRHLAGNELKRFVVRQETTRFPYWSKVWRIADKVESPVKRLDDIRAV